MLITGAAGFVGRHLVRALRLAWPDVPVLTPALDVCDGPAVSAAIAAASPAHCVHLAAIASVGQAAQDHARAWRVNLEGTLNVARAILTHAPHCQMIFASSADAYGASFRRGTPLDEDAALAPMNVYGATKAAADLALGALACEGLRAVRLRPFNHIGPGQSPDFVLASFSRQIARAEAGLQAPVVQVGRLDTWRDFLDVRDVCTAYVACLARHDALAPGTILNLASGTARRIGEVLEEMIAASARALEVRQAAPRVRPTDILRAAGNAGRAAALLGWTPDVAWQDTLACVLHDWRKRVAAAGDAA